MSERERPRPTPESLAEMGDRMDEINQPTADQPMVEGVTYRPRLVDRVLPPGTRRRSVATKLGVSAGLAGAAGGAGLAAEKAGREAYGVSLDAQTVAKDAARSVEDAGKSIDRFFNGEGGQSPADAPSLDATRQSVERQAREHTAPKPDVTPEG